MINKKFLRQMGVQMRGGLNSFFMGLAFLAFLNPLHSADEPFDSKVGTPKKGEVTASALHYREGPGVETKSLGTNPKGTSVNILAVQNGWYKIGSSPDKWSSGTYIKVTEYDYQESEALKPAEGAKVTNQDSYKQLKTPIIPHLDKAGDSVPKGKKTI